MVGLLAVSEIFIEAEEPFKEYKGGVEYRGLLGELPPFSLFKKYWLTMIRSPIIGTIVGALPGAGATIAAFLAYGEAGAHGQARTGEVRQGCRGGADGR